MEKLYARRKIIVIGLFLFFGLIFLIRLFYIQVIADKYILSANNNVLRYITQYPARGLIYDRFGKLLVYNEAAYDLMVTPKQVKAIDTLALCNLIGIEKKDFIERLKKARNYSTYRASIFEAQISRENYGYLEEKMFKFPGFFVQPRTLRKYSYPYAAHTFGYIGEVGAETVEKDPYYRSGDYIGVSGVEKSYEKELRGKKGLKIRVVDVFNRDKGSFQDGRYDTNAFAGTDLYSSLDIELQGYRKKNYTILSEDSIFVPLFNRALMAMYPPGSTFKLVDALVGQQEGVLHLDTRYGCPGGYSLGNGKMVGCHPHWGPLDLKQSIQYSCNTYYCRVFKSIIDKKPFTTTREGYESWRNHVMSFGFGKKLNCDLPGELNGNIPSSNYYDKYHGKNRWRSLSIISLAIGQGEIGITPLQLANLSALISNRGFYYVPHIVRSIGTKEGQNKNFQTKRKCDIDPDYFDIVIEAMHDVVEAGTATGAKVDSIAICGKTGTAQNPHGKNHSIFIAFAPMKNSEIAISVVVENAGYGSEWAVPIASLMIEKYLKREVKRKELEQRMIDGNLIQAK
jgi:penicillin-binding protein 2